MCLKALLAHVVSNSCSNVHAQGLIQGVHGIHNFPSKLFPDSISGVQIFKIFLGDAPKPMHIARAC